MVNIEFLENINESEEIRRNITQLLNIRAGTVVSDREMGISYDSIDSIESIAKAQMIAEITDKVERYEPRVLVDNITVSGNMDELDVYIKVVRNDDYDEDMDNENEEDKGVENEDD